MTIVQSKCKFCTVITTGKVCGSKTEFETCEIIQSMNNFWADMRGEPKPFPHVGTARPVSGDADAFDLESIGGTMQ